MCIIQLDLGVNRNITIAQNRAVHICFITNFVINRWETKTCLFTKSF